MAIFVMDAPESVTVRSINPFSQSLLAAVEAHDEVVCDLSAVSEMDLSLIQVIEAARMRRFEEGGTLRLLQPAGPELTLLLDRAGFLTKPDTADIEFWFHGRQP